MFPVLSNIILALKTLLLSCVLPYLRSPKGDCCSMSDDLSCSRIYLDFLCKY